MSGVVAASLSVVLISVLLGMVVTFWVPVWGYDNEVEHSRQVINAFGQFKNALELITLSGNVNQTVTTSFPLGVGAVPLFGADTPGALSFQALEGGRVRSWTNLTDATGQVNLSATNSLEYSIANRNFVRQDMAYELGGVVVSQPDGQTMRLTPPFRFVNGTQGLDVYLTLFTLDGPQAVVSGVDTHTVSARLSVAYTLTYSWSPANTVTLSLTTEWQDAWARYFGDAMNSSSVNASAFTVTEGAGGGAPAVTFTLSGVRSLTVTESLVQVKVD